MRLRRVPDSSEPNLWSQRLDARRRSGAPLHDLVQADPTRLGLSVLDAGDLAALADPGVATYAPDARGDARARDAIAAYYAGRGESVSAEHLVLTSGTSEGYAHLFRLLCAPGERVLVPRPCYPLFEPIAEVEGVRVATYPLARRGRWELDVDALAAAVDGDTRAIVVVQPHHPTGWRPSGEERDALERICAERRLALIADEVFLDFPGPGAGARAVPSLVTTTRALTFVLSGLSKVAGLPQMKLGWIAVAGPAQARADALAGLEWIADLFLSVGLPVQLATPRFLAGAERFRTRTRERIARNRAELEARLGGSRARVHESEGGWMACVDLPDERDDEEWALALLDRGVVVHPGYFYDFESGPTIVASLITEPDTWDAGLGILREAIV